MLLPVLRHADTKHVVPAPCMALLHVVPAPCMALLQRPGGGGQMQSLNASGGHATRWDDAAHRTSRLAKAVARARSVLCWRRAPTSLNVAVSPGAGRPMSCRGTVAGRQQRSCAAAEIRQKQQSARQGENAACRPTWLSMGRGTVAGLLGSHLIGAACPHAPRGAPCPYREGCSDRGTLGSRLKEQK
jgi:hypothetical protein